MGAAQTSITICCLNEERNIANCINSVRANGPLEIIVLDGGSTDRTVEIAKGLADKVLELPGTTLAYRRNEGAKQARGQYLAMVDADQTLPADALDTLVKELEASGYSGIQTQILSESNETYWERGMEKNFVLAHNIPGPRIVIGTPALYRRDVFVQYGVDGALTASCDDTDWCYRMVRDGHKLGIGTVVAKQRHRATFGQTVKKWRWYGKGDAQFFMKHPARRLSIFMHPLKNYMWGRSVKAVRAGIPQYIPYFLIIGLARHFGFWEAMLKMGVQYLRTGSARDLDYKWRT